jgi:hypothetical protein
LSGFAFPVNPVVALNEAIRQLETPTMRTAIYPGSFDTLTNGHPKLVISLETALEARLLLGGPPKPARNPPRGARRRRVILRAAKRG